MSGLDKIPRELVMTSFLPFLDGVSLNQLSLVNRRWCNTVRDFLREFNKVVQLSVSHMDNIFYFLTKEANKLVKLELVWNTGTMQDNKLLCKVISNNQGRRISFDHKFYLGFININ